MQGDAAHAGSIGSAGSRAPRSQAVSRLAGRQNRRSEPRRVPGRIPCPRGADEAQQLATGAAVASTP
jgi:hypothetical protein